MSDRLMSRSERTGASALRAAYDRARLLKERAKAPDQQIPKNIKRHQHTPVMAPKKSPLRYGPDARKFAFYEALDRKQALQRRERAQSPLQQQKGFTLER